MFNHLTLGVLASWQVYEENTLSKYVKALFEGIRAAATEKRCNLLLSCGVGPVARPDTALPAWPILQPQTTFVPVGPWNADGLIIIPPIYSEASSHYLHELRAHGYPMVFTGSGEQGPCVASDNASGIFQAVAHLYEHGHRRIAYIAGYEAMKRGESADRLHFYKQALKSHGLDESADLIIYGQHTVEDSAKAMHALLAKGVSFTAVMASNDVSAIGAMQALRQAGLQIPDDVAVIGFDNILDAKAQMPPLTTVRQSIFEIGYQAVCLLLESIHQTQPTHVVRQIPTRLIVRRSCGCHPGDPIRRTLSPDADLTAFISTITDAVVTEMQHLDIQQAAAMCQALVMAFVESMEQRNAASLTTVLKKILNQSDTAQEDVHLWHAVVAQFGFLLRQRPDAQREHGMQTLHQAHLIIGEFAQWQFARHTLQVETLTDQLGAMSARLLTASEPRRILHVLDEDLPAVGIRRAHIVMFEAQDDDPVARSSLWLQSPHNDDMASVRFASRSFPPAGFYAADEPFCLALLPLTIQGRQAGYVVFEAQSLEACAAVTRQIAPSLLNSQLYREAVAARLLAEEANQLKSRFLSMVSHELRTPLNIIVGLSELLLREYQRGTSVSITDVERIHASALHLGGLIRDVLDLASSEAGQLRLDYEPLDLVETLQLALNTGQQLAADKGLAWRVHLPNDRPQVWGDRTRLRQVLLNLISNAVKFTSQGWIQVSIQTDVTGVQVQVQDTGVGIPQADQPIIFDEFRQSERTSSRGYGGLGLGLAISRQLIALHGGEIGVFSSGIEGEGATFSIRLPLASLPEAPFETLGDQTVLLLLRSDNPTVSAYLEQQGFSVKTQIVNEHWTPQTATTHPAAIVLEKGLAAEQGWEIVRAIKSAANNPGIPIIFFSLSETQQSGSMLDVEYHFKPLHADQVGHLLHTGDAVQNVLIVDDDAGILDLHTRLLREHDPTCTIRHAHNGREALDMIRQTPPDLILLDLMMPELDGFGVLEALHQDRTTRNIPVIVLTSQMITEEHLARLNQGVVAVLEKDVFSPQETLRRVAAALERTATLSGPTRQLVRKAMTYLHTHYADSITREQIAQYVGLSEDYLTSCFHQELGITPMTYLNRYRIKQARRLLEQPDLKMTQIAMAVGFSDSAYFCRVFQRETGVTPSAYRRARRGMT